MSGKTDQAGFGRRGFMGAFAALGSAAAAAVLGTKAVGEARAQESDDEKRKARYEETDHVKAFYRTNRY